MRLQGRVIEETVRSEVGRTNIGVKAECFPKREETLFGANFVIDTPFGSTNCTYEVERVKE